MKEQPTQLEVDSIDWEKLEKGITEILGMKEQIKFTKSFDKKGYFDIQSQNIVSHAGVFKAVFSEVVVNNFGGGIVLNKENKKVLWLGMHLSWEHTDGGSNGTKIMNVWWNFDIKSWVMENKNEQAS